MTLDEKIACDMPLCAADITRATGYSRKAIKEIKPPFVCKKIRLTDFWRHIHTLQNFAPVTIGTPEITPDAIDAIRREFIVANSSSPESSNDQQSDEDTLRAQRKSYVQQGASLSLERSPLRNIE